MAPADATDPATSAAGDDAVAARSDVGENNGGADVEEKEESRRPKGSNFRQQKVRAWIPILTPGVIVAWFVVIAAIFIPVGITLLEVSDDVVVMSQQYDGDGTDSALQDCKVTEEGMSTSCEVTFKVEEDLDPPIYVYYELNNYFQNHRRYVKSRSAPQLLGSEPSRMSDCDPIRESADGFALNPCGLIANTFFNDTFSIISSTGSGFSNETGGSYLDETNISWKVDRTDRFKQPDDFATVQVGPGACTSSDVSDTNCQTCLGAGKYPCSSYTDSEGNEHLFYYPDDQETSSGRTQYLYTTYPGIISPIEGVENEHFQVWMRAAGLPKFRKIYGVINHPLIPGDEVVFNVTANYFVASFDGKKSIMLSTLSKYGAKNGFLGIAYLVLGSISIMLAVGFTVMAIKYPRELGDPKFVDAKQYVIVKR